MFENRLLRSLAVLAAVSLVAINAQAATIELVPVGNPRNPGELSGVGAGGWGPNRVCGGVNYTYQIGTFEVTAGQYTEFLNAVAKVDTYGLYGWWMNRGNYSPKIRRIGEWNNFTYVVDANGDDVEDADWVNRPVVEVSWADAARFANWMHNGQPRGKQDLTTTEDGSYYLNGATSLEDIMAVTRKPGATWVIPTEDEWYKAAYHKNDGVTGNYWHYPTGTNEVPSNALLDPDPGNNANWAVLWPSLPTIGSPYYRTEVGAFENSESPYGTFDQGGNVWEWTEGVITDRSRVMRGSSFHNSERFADGTPAYLHASVRTRRAWSDLSDLYDATLEDNSIGFRLVHIPEPSSVAMLAVLALTGLLWWWRRHG